jgi:hypothetical protein
MAPSSLASGAVSPAFGKAPSRRTEQLAKRVVANLLSTSWQHVLPPLWASADTMLDKKMA